jgi:hypothetical protein
VRLAVDDNSDQAIPDLVAAVQPQVQAVDAAAEQIDGVLACPVPAEG